MINKDILATNISAHPGWPGINDSFNATGHIT